MWGAKSEAVKAAPVEVKAVPATKAVSPDRKKLSNKERQELKELPGHIDAMEAEQAALGETMSDPKFYRKPQEEVQAASARAEALPGLIQAAYDRWDELSDD